MQHDKHNVIPAADSRKAAKLFFYGNIIAVILAFPLVILWFGASMFVYAMYRHHPNGRVGYYTQIAAYHYYGLIGSLVPILTFAPGDFFLKWWWALWLLIMAVTIPLAVHYIRQINREEWHDTVKTH